MLNGIASAQNATCEKFTIGMSPIGWYGGGGSFIAGDADSLIWEPKRAFGQPNMLKSAHE